MNQNAPNMKHLYRRKVCINDANFTKSSKGVVPVGRQISHFWGPETPKYESTNVKFSKTKGAEGASVVPTFHIDPNESPLQDEKPQNRHLSKFNIDSAASNDIYIPVSYTHLTLPTKRIV